MIRRPVWGATTAGGSAARIARAFSLLAVVHSLLASRQAKDLAGRLIGRRYRDGLYRIAYVGQALAGTAGFAVWFLGLPDRELYRVRAPYARLWQATQLASLGMLLATIRVVGLTRISGLAPFAQLLTGREPVPAPEAQGPPPGADGELHVAGPFRFTRHPDNLPFLGVFWFFPRMTANCATLATLVTLYALLGSLHEDYRLRAAYGAAYERYRRRYPFFWPRLHP